MSIRDSLTAVVYQFLVGITIFFVFQVVGNDIVEEWVDVVLTNDVVDGVTVANVVIFFSLIGVFAALTITNALTFNIRVPRDIRQMDPNSAKALRSLISTWFMVFIFTYSISTIALTQFPNFAITVVNFFLLPTLFMIFVLNPATYLFMVAILFIIWNFIFNARLGVEI